MTHSSSWRWWVCGVLLLATFLNYMDRQALAVTLPELKREFNLAERRIGMVEGCFGFAFAAGALLFGILADRFGPRKLYPIVLTGWSLAGIATGFAGHTELTRLLESPDDEPGAGPSAGCCSAAPFSGCARPGTGPAPSSRSSG